MSEPIQSRVSESNSDYQIGSHEVSDNFVPLGEGADGVEFKLETAAVFKQLADEMYKSLEAGFREPTTNAVTAVLNLERQYDSSVNLTEPQIEFTLIIENDELTLLIEDHGIGIKKEVLENILSYIGRSSIRDEGDLGGQYGMGFLALFKPVGIENGFFMFTNSVESNEDSIRGVWNSKGFTYDTKEVLEPRKNGTDHGTLFELPLKSEISKSEVNEWIERNAKFARVPISYKQIDESGNVLREKLYDTTTLTEHYEDSDSIIFSRETEYYNAYVTTESNSRTILLDVPVSRGTNISLPYGNLDIRFKDENGIITEGEHTGLTPVHDDEYASMDTERQEKYIPRSELTEGDIPLPSPTGTRDSLTKSRDYWNFIETEFRDDITQKMSECLQQVQQDKSFQSLSDTEYEFVVNGLCSSIKRRHKSSPQRFGRKIHELFDINLSNEFSEKLISMFDTVFEYDPNTPLGSGYKRKHGRKRGKQSVWRVGVDAEQVFMARSVNASRAKVVWDDDSSNRVIEVDSASDYEIYQQLFGWKKLTSIKRSTLDEFDISASVKSEFLKEFGTNSSTSRGDNITVRLKNRTLSVTLEKLYETITNTSDTDEKVTLSTYKSFKELVLFPTTSDKKISNFYSLATSDLAIARCSKSASDLLTETPWCVTIDEYESRSNPTVFETPEGNIDITGMENIIFHIMDSYEWGELMTPQKYPVVTGYVRNRWNYTNETDLTYVPIQPDKYESIKHMNLRDDVKILTSNEIKGVRGANSVSYSNIAELYLKAINESDRSMDEDVTSLLEGIRSYKMKHKTETRAVFKIIDEFTN
jgi:hypothetical protein